MVKKYYENFPRLPLQILADLAIEHGIRSITDARIATHGLDVILEVQEEGLSINLENILSIAEYFDAAYLDVSVSSGHRPGLVVIDIMNQGAFELGQAFRGDDVIEVDDYDRSGIEVEFDPYLGSGYGSDRQTSIPKSQCDD